jgi:phosphinothricin acetyltransferase
MSSEDRDEVLIRPGTPGDLVGINAIYNRFVVESPVTFDVNPVTIEERTSWFDQFDTDGPHRLMVSAQNSQVVGFAYSKEFRQRRAYETSVEPSIYLTPDASGRGIGTLLYTALFEALADEDLHRACAGITLPNDASIALHEKCGFRPVGTFEEVGRKFGRFWSVRWYQKDLP